MDSNPQICPLCAVTIDPAAGSEEEVTFSSGSPASRTKLWARVCQFAKSDGCINNDPSLRGIPGPDDLFGDATELDLSGAA